MLDSNCNLKNKIALITRLNWLHLTLLEPAQVNFPTNCLLLLHETLKIPNFSDEIKKVCLFMFSESGNDYRMFKHSTYAVCSLSELTFFFNSALKKQYQPKKWLFVIYYFDNKIQSLQKVSNYLFFVYLFPQHI